MMLSSMCVCLSSLGNLPHSAFITHHYADHYLIKAFFSLRAPFVSFSTAREHHQLVEKDKLLL
jgi:hypothetical protein